MILALSYAEIKRAAGADAIGPAKLNTGDYVGFVGTVPQVQVDPCVSEVASWSWRGCTFFCSLIFENYTGARSKWSGFASRKNL